MLNSSDRVLRLVVLLMPLLLVDVAGAQDFGKVFSTPQQRDYLDRLRREMFRNLSEEERIQALQATEDEPPPIIEAVPTLIHMGGSVRRADGRYTVWINGLPVDEDELPGNTELAIERGMGILIVQSAESSFRLRPGQTLNVEEGTVREDYQLTEAQAATVRGEMARREALNRRPEPTAPVRTAETNDDGDEQKVEENDEEQQELIQDVLDALRSVQQARDIQNAVLP